MVLSVATYLNNTKVTKLKHPTLILQRCSLKGLDAKKCFRVGAVISTILREVRYSQETASVLTLDALT
ncbi:hypothetical protein SLEP1_g11692 [Rubroshorea leprosula]|nr:hypothetical protein SLEP1_g11692 [Rubroshorea leprosula]